MLKKVYKTVRGAITKISEDEIFLYAAQSSFYIVTASIPFMMLFLALIEFIVPITEVEAVALAKTLVPGILESPIEAIIKELFNRSTAVISITGITALWSASRGVAAVERGVKKVYKTKKERMFFIDIAFSVFYTVLFIIALLLTLLLMVFGGTIYDILGNYWLWLQNIEKIMGGLQELMYFVGLNVFFAFVYKVFAGKNASLKKQLPGAFFTTSGWFLFSFIFSVYVENFANYSYVYGSLTILVLMMLWLYSCMVILLLGAEINVYMMKRERK